MELEFLRRLELRTRLVMSKFRLLLPVFFHYIQIDVQQGKVNNLGKWIVVLLEPSEKMS